MIANFCLLADQASRHAAKTDVAYHGATTLHPIGLASVILLGIWLLFASRKSALMPLMILICLIPSAQRVVIFGADFTLLRIMVLFGITRIIARGELSAIKPNRIDYAYITWVLVGSLAYLLQQQDLGALVYICGRWMDMLGAYVLARATVRTIDDLWGFATIAAVLAIGVSVFFVIEHMTGRNIFSIFGGVSPITMVRNDRLRCQGAFAHPILAGVFWAAIFALVSGGVIGSKKRLFFTCAAVCCVLIVGASASSTPVLGLAAAIAFWAWWPIRGWMRYAFVIAPFVLILLHFIMEKPVWHLVARLSAVGGSTGYHRYILIDSAIGHFHEWWLVGTASTVHWSDAFQTWDITNQYILEGVRGGIWRLGLFIALIYLVSIAISHALRRAKNKPDKLLLWGFAASLFVHCVCFIGVSYFGQIQYLWYMMLAIGGSVGSSTFFPPNELTTVPRGTLQRRDFVAEQSSKPLTGINV